MYLHGEKDLAKQLIHVVITLAIQLYILKLQQLASYNTVIALCSKASYIPIQLASILDAAQNVMNGLYQKEIGWEIGGMQNNTYTAPNHITNDGSSWQHKTV